MKSNDKRLVANDALGATTDSATHAHQVKTPPAYLVAEVSAITDPIAMKSYGARVPETLAPFNGHYVVRGGETEILEGDAPIRIVIIAFDSSEQAHAWYDSPAYAAIRPIRERASKVRIFIVEGVAP
jgi:uncharacterized protein (DUF1330 family)